jgi:hypothetical protein
MRDFKHFRRAEPTVAGEHRRRIRQNQEGRFKLGKLRMRFTHLVILEAHAILAS